MDGTYLSEEQLLKLIMGGVQLTNQQHNCTNKKQLFALGIVPPLTPPRLLTPLGF